MLRPLVSVATVLPFLLLPCITVSAAPLSDKDDSPSNIPLVIWHGLGDRFDSEGMEAIGDLYVQIYPGATAYVVKTNDDAGTDQRDGYFGDMNKHVEHVCAEISAHAATHNATEVNAIGFSQGGQFMRAYVERCNDPPVRNLITFGSQHNGIRSFAACGAMDWLCQAWEGLLEGNVWSDYAQHNLVPAQYYRPTPPVDQEAEDEDAKEEYEKYLKLSNFIADINNEREAKNATYKANLEKLQRFVMYVFADDTTVMPKGSGWFAEGSEDTGDYIPLQNRTLYTEDWLGLKSLDEKGRLALLTTPGKHMQIGADTLETAFRKYFKPGPDDDSRVQNSRLDKAKELLDCEDCILEIQEYFGSTFVNIQGIA